MAGPKHLCPAFLFFPTQHYIHTKNIQTVWAESMTALPILPGKLVSGCSKPTKAIRVMGLPSFSSLPPDITLSGLRTISTPERSVRWYLQTAKALYCAGSLGWFLEETLWGTLLWSTAQLNSHFFWYTRKTVSKKATRDIWLTEHCCCWYLCFQKDKFLAFSFVERVNSAIINKRQMSVIIWSECTW